MTGGFYEAELTRDGFLGGRLSLRQPVTGYRAAIDPVLLAAFAPARTGDTVLDLGCGAGAAALCLGARVPGLEMHGLEVQPAYAALARRNASENALSLRVHDGDLRDPPSDLRQRVFDIVLMNPPFHLAHAATGSHDAGRDAAHREGEAELPDWIAAGLRRLRPGGALAVIHLAARLPDILGALAGRAGAVEVLPVSTHADRPATRVLVRAGKGRRAPMLLHPPLVLHEAAAMGYRSEAEAVLRGGAPLLPCTR